MNIRLITLLACLLILNGCATTQLDERYVGTTDYHYRKFGKDKFEPNIYYSPDYAECIKKGEQFDIRLDTQIINQSFEGFMENISEGAFLGFSDSSKNTNEIGIFLTVQELNRESQTDKFVAAELSAEQTRIDNRLIYTSFSRKKGQPLNQRNKLVYSGTYSGNDLRFIVEVREFDKENGEGMMEVIKLLSEEASKYTQAANPFVGNILNKLGNAAKNGLFKDDVIASFDMEFVPCGVYKDKQQIYLAQGQILFLRHSQNNDFERQNDLTWDNAKNKPIGGNANGKSFTSFLIYRRERVSNE